MRIIEINNLLKHNEQNLRDWFSKVEEERWISGPDGKWTSAQHLLHLIQSSKPLIKGVSMPSWILNYKFGKNNREQRSYDEVIHRYHTKLSNNTNLLSPFSSNMPIVNKGDVQGLLNKFSHLNDKLIKKSNRLKEKKLDLNLLPHPLMGRMTIREILMWNAYHTEHHNKILLDKY